MFPFFIAGACSGFANAFISGPVELAKCLQQQAALGTLSVKPPSTLSILQNACRRWGVRGPYRGLLATILRDTPSFGAYFFTYESIMSYSASSQDSSARRDLYMEFERLVERYGCEPKPPMTQCVSTTEGVSLMLTLFAGAMSGIMSWLVTYPLDVVKTRIQSTQLDQKPMGIIRLFSLLYREQGIRSLFAGFHASMIRAIPTNAVTFLAFSLTITNLERHFG